MLRHINEPAIAERILAALRAVLSAGIRTRDLGGTASTMTFAEAICQRLPAEVGQSSTGEAKPR
jgi:isocitrate/isopropylmalate dehydrogenase